MTQCKACTRIEKDWRGDEPKCGFTTGVFTEDNWSCATVSAIRELCRRRNNNRQITVGYFAEQNYAVIGTCEQPILPVEDAEGYMTEQPIALWVGWYKNRGRTEAMWLMFDRAPPRAPTEEEVIAILKIHGMDINP